jgi:hypothetical protein
VAVGGVDHAGVEVFQQSQRALGEIRRIKGLGKKSIKAVIERAVLPDHFQPLESASKDFRAAAHIRDLVFAQVGEPQLTFAEETPMHSKPTA